MGTCNRFTFSLFTWTNQQNASTNSISSCLWCPSLGGKTSQHQPGCWFLAVLIVQVSRLSEANGVALSAVIVRLLWLQRNSLLIRSDWWAHGKGSRLWPYQSRSISCSSHLLLHCLSLPACSQWKCEWASRWRGGLSVTIHPRTSFTVLLSQVLSLRDLLWKKKED